MTQGPQWKVSVQLHEKANTSSPVPKEVRDSFPRIALENRALIQKQHFWEGEKQNKNPGCLAYIQVLERVSRCNSSEGRTNSSVPASSKRRVALAVEYEHRVLYFALSPEGYLPVTRMDEPSPPSTHTPRGGRGNAGLYT